ncbi:MAG: efflux RND transporter periplasmic adaptor subunit [Planctomycetia bacterium]|nr:efflux RND transporter periplasmic adaptor subunit [Planctomycetia bacterium]
MNRRSTFERYGWAVTALLCVAIAGQVAHGHDDDPPLPLKGATVQGDRLTLSDSAAKAIGLATAKVTLGDLVRTVVAHASVDVPCHHHAYATTLVSGKIAELLARPGDLVEAGQALARIESVSLENLQLQLLQAVEELALAKISLEQRERAAAALPETKILEARAAWREKMAEYRIARERLRSLGMSAKELDEVEASRLPRPTIAVASPIAGRIAAVDARVGQIVEPGDHLYDVVDRSEVWIVGDVLESDAAAIRIGLAATARFEATGDRTFRGEIEYVSLSVDAAKRAVAARFTVDNEGEMLQPGMFGRMTITVADAPKAVVCPAAAILTDAKGPFVVLDDGRGRFLRRPVDIGLRTHDAVEINDGLFPGDRVVTTGNHELAALWPTQTASGQIASSARSPRGSSVDVVSGKTISVRGEVELPTDRQAFASSTISGQIRALLVKRGQHVNEGDVLAEVESLELKTWQLDLLQTRIVSEFTKTSLERTEERARQGAVPDKDVFQMRSKYHTLLQTEQSLVQKLRMAGLSDDDIRRLEQVDLTDPQAGERIAMALPVRAPMSGTLADRELALGEVVAPNQQLFEIQDPSRMWVHGFLFERDARGVRVGDRADIRLVSRPGWSTSATIARINPVLSSAQRAVSVWAELDNGDLSIKEGMLARMVIRKETAPDAVAGDGAEPATARLPR